MSGNGGAKNVKADSGIVVIESATSSQVEKALKDGHCVTKSGGEYHILIETGGSGKTAKSSSLKKRQPNRNQNQERNTKNLFDSIL